MKTETLLIVGLVAALGIGGFMLIKSSQDATARQLAELKAQESSTSQQSKIGGLIGSIVNLFG